MHAGVRDVLNAGVLVAEVTNVLLSGIVGSVAYGLATEDSDTDRLGMFACPTEKVLGLYPPVQSIVRTSPDITFHEVGKFLSLALKCNPTITELLWLPDDLYETRTDLGDKLIGIRQSLLSATLVRNAYLGYATQQFRRLENRSEHGDHSFSADTRKRTAKHARHLLRLLHQGMELYETGTLIVRLADPDWYHRFGDIVAEGDIQAAQREISAAEKWINSADPALPEKPDLARAEQWLLDVRRRFWAAPEI